MKEIKKVYALLWKNWKNKHASSIHIKDISFISEDLELIEKHKKSSLTLDKPIFTGQTYLDKSKILLYAIKYE